jgi:hypothetical protein
MYGTQRRSSGFSFFSHQNLIHIPEWSFVGLDQVGSVGVTNPFVIMMLQLLLAAGRGMAVAPPCSSAS